MSTPRTAACPACANCANCGAPFVPERRRFCPECGQETTVDPPRVRDFLQQFGGAYFSTEGALWRTLKLLLTRPGELTVQYLRGRRKHHVLPLRLYLSISLMVFLLARLLGGVEVVRGLDGPEMLALEQGPMRTLVLSVGPAKLGVREGAFVCDYLPGLVCAVIQARAAPDTRTFLHHVRRANERLLANLGAVMFVLLPLFAACLLLVNRGSGMVYAEHLVFALHLHAFWFIVLALMRLAPPPLEVLGGLCMVAYTLLAGSRVYGGRWLPRLLRATLLTLMYMTLLALTLPLAWLLALVA